MYLKRYAKCRDKKGSQNQQILRHLQSGKAITQIDAFELFGCFRLASRIHDLRQQGYAIETQTTKSRNSKYATYFIKERK
tara:strand:- start:3226 stop:3465 length:240 start_codon:yes stop_codon:yes gene_type:complete